MASISVTVAGSNSVIAGFGQELSRNVAQTTTLDDATIVPPAPSANTQIGDPQRDFVRVSSSIGRAASSGQLSRQEAVDIYRQIASLL
jgi:hypothetical protein